MIAVLRFLFVCLWRGHDHALDVKPWSFDCRRAVYTCCRCGWVTERVERGDWG